MLREVRRRPVKVRERSEGGRAACRDELLLSSGNYCQRRRRGRRARKREVEHEMRRKEADKQETTRVKFGEESVT